MLIKLQQNFPILLLFILLGFFSYISWTNKMFADGSDEIAHYFISKYSVSHPGLLLDLWGKPIFTILSAPFSQFGYIGLKIFNVIIGILTGYVTYIISKKTHNQNSWLSIVFLLFTPIYFVVMQSGLTEILFSFVVATTVSLFLSKKFVLSAIVISIIPLVRNEGFIFFPLIVMSLIFVKQYRIIPLVFSGMIIFGLLSHFFKQDFFYFFNSSPYPLEAYSVYGKGSLEHFFINKNYLFGPIVEMFFWVGVVASFVDIKNNNGKKRITKIIELLLIVGIFFTYIFAHSLVWWLGIGRSLGMLRVVAGVAPLSAIIALKGMNSIINVSKKFVPAQWLLYLVVFIGIHTVFTTINRAKNLFINNSGETAAIQEAVIWYRNSYFETSKIYYFDPFVPYYLYKDPFNDLEIQIANKNVFISNGIINQGLIFWDNHFAPNEGGVPLNLLSESSDFQQLKEFSSDDGFSVVVFKKIR